MHKHATRTTTPPSRRPPRTAAPVAALDWWSVLLVCTGGRSPDAVRGGRLLGGFVVHVACLCVSCRTGICEIKVRRIRFGEALFPLPPHPPISMLMHLGTRLGRFAFFSQGVALQSASAQHCNRGMGGVRNDDTFLFQTPDPGGPPSHRTQG